MRHQRAWLGPMIAAAFLSGCTFSTGTTTEVTAVGQGAPAATAPGALAAPGSASVGAPSTVRTPTAPSGPGTTPLCRELQAVYLTNLSDQRGAASVLTGLGQVSALAPRDLKPAINTLGAYLVAAARGDLATAKGAAPQVDNALSQIDRYLTSTCHS